MLICDARPCARGRNRFNVVPSFTYASLTYNELISKFKLCSAFAIADFKTFSTIGDAALGVCFKLRMLRLLVFLELNQSLSVLYEEQCELF